MINVEQARVSADFQVNNEVTLLVYKMTNIYFCGCFLFPVFFEKHALQVAPGSGSARNYYNDRNTTVFVLY